jgi:hypothetical protein
MNSSEEASHRRFALRFCPPMAIYVVSLMVMIPLMREAASLQTRILMGLVPLLPLAWAMVELVRHVADLDEMQRRIYFESGGMAGLMTCALLFSWTFMEMAGLPPLPAVVVLPVFCGIFAIRYWQLSRRIG